jgi:hypothetical protein
MAENEDPLADPVAVIVTLQQYQKKLSTQVMPMCSLCKEFHSFSHHWKHMRRRKIKSVSNICYKIIVLTDPASGALLLDAGRAAAPRCCYLQDFPS